MDEIEDLLLSDAPLLEDESTVTLDIFTEQTLQGSYGLEQTKVLEGKITVPKDARVFWIPPTAGTTGQPCMAPDRTKVDLYLICLPFTLHEPPVTAYYEKVTFFVELASKETVAFDLFPRNITSSSEVTRTYKLSPQITIEPVGLSFLGEITRQITFTSLRPVITAFGEGEHSFYWVYRGTEDAPKVVPETKQALIILQVPLETAAVDGQIHYEVVLAKRRFGTWRSTQPRVDSLPVYWTLRGTPPFFAVEAHPAAASVSRALASSQPLHVDVCVICGLAEEADAFVEVTSRLCGAAFKQGLQTNNRAYRYTTIQNNKGEDLTLLVSWFPKYGPLEAGLHIKPLLEEFKPCFVTMTGICAGDRRKVSLGDLVVAERAFVYDSGKFVRAADGSLKQLPDIDSQHIDTAVLHFVQMFNAWKPDVYALARPASKRQQREWLLNRLLEEPTASVDDIPRAELELHAPSWRKIVHELTAGPDAYLTEERTLRDKDRVNQLRNGLAEFPFTDPLQPIRHIAPVASGSSVRGDDPFADIQKAVRDTLAIDMEAAAFYRTVADFPAMQALLVKGVSDYADSDKDDAYHKYAAEVSAIYILDFIKAYSARGIRSD